MDKYRVNSATHDLPRTTIQTILNRIVELLKSIDMEYVDVVFGFGWGVYFAEWNTLHILVHDLVPLVEFVESRGHGSLSEDDLTLRIKWTSIELCHDGGVHVAFQSKSDLIMKLHGILEESGLQPWTEAYRDAIAKKDAEYWDKKRAEWVRIDISECE